MVKKPLGLDPTAVVISGFRMIALGKDTTQARLSDESNRQRTGVMGTILAQVTLLEPSIPTEKKRIFRYGRD